jgi:nucleoid-associated protein EbfC
MSRNPFGNLGNMMKQAQAMQEQLAKIQEQAAGKTVEGTAGGGMVSVTANGAMEIVAVKIDPEVFKSGDIDMLQDLIVAASGEALRRAKDMMANEMKSITGGMQIPGLF